MNKINRKVEYALMSLKYMVRKSPGEKTTAKEVSENFGTPFDVTARVMQALAHRGLLHSEQGAAGGYLIKKDLNRVSLLELMEMIDGPTKLVKCFQKGSSCEIKSQCNIISPLQNLNQKFKNFYQSVTLNELLVEPQKERHV